MASYDYLVDHARKNVWCAPKQDTQVIVRPARLTPIGGVWNTVDVLWRKLKLPEQGPRFHVFQVGQIHPRLMGLFDVFNDWELLSDAMHRQNLITDVYTTAGISLPRTQIWYRITLDRDLVLAVKENSSVGIDYSRTPIYLRVYSNAYYNSTEHDPVNEYVDVQGGIMSTEEDIMTLQTQYATAAALPGGIQAFVNGRAVNAISFVTTHVGDVAEYVFDSSIYLTETWNISGLPDFVSTLDSKHKYLLHYAGIGARGIDFQDDLDLFVVNPSGSIYQGVFYHRNQPDAVRMVTHKDYSIPVSYITSIASENFWNDASVLRVIAHIRKSGFHRPLVYEAQRIQELYKMADSDVAAAMVGLQATVPPWAAPNLEASAYARLMGVPLSQITRELVEDAYGYNAVSKLLADTPRLTALVSGEQEVSVPYGLVQDSTSYEYDSNGVLINWYHHVYGTIYRAANSNCAMVEQIAGGVATLLEEYYGNEPLTLDPTVEWRFYRCPIVTGTPNNVFVDVTDSANYALINGNFTWLHDPTQWFGLVRSNRVTLGYRLNLAIQSGNLRFSLAHDQIRNGVQQNWVMQVPMGELDLWLNGKSLIEGLDYVVHFPEIVIVNKEYLINPTTDTQRVDIRFSGFCKSDLTREVPQDVGFVKYALLSENSRFDIRDDKVLRITVGGQLKARSQLLFSETDSGVTVPDARNGAPYQIRDLVVPLRGATLHDTYTLRAIDQIVDQQISDYMTLKLPMPVIGTPNAIVSRYAVFSPFCCAIIYDLISGTLNPPSMYGFMSDQNVFDACRPYEHLLPYDPTQEPNVPDDEFVMIHPHNLNVVMSLNIYQYRFAQRMVDLYLHGKVSLSTFIQMT